MKTNKPISITTKNANTGGHFIFLPFNAQSDEDLAKTLSVYVAKERWQNALGAGEVNRYRHF